MLKPLFIKRKQLNFQKHIGRATLTALKRIQRDKAHGLGCLRVDQHRPGGFAREQGQGVCQFVQRAQGRYHQLRAAVPPIG